MTTNKDCEALLEAMDKLHDVMKFMARSGVPVVDASDRILYSKSEDRDAFYHIIYAYIHIFYYAREVCRDKQ